MIDAFQRVIGRCYEQPGWRHGKRSLPGRDFPRVALSARMNRWRGNDVSPIALNVEPRRELEALGPHSRRKGEEVVLPVTTCINSRRGRERTVRSFELR